MQSYSATISAFGACIFGISPLAVALLLSVAGPGILPPLLGVLMIADVFASFSQMAQVKRIIDRTHSVVEPEGLRWL
ncbi:hypothetical protein A3709_09075 [Halioglobus sp. HI00S01]|nr:hypothetical protein [Halioglobus sp. HI00S01]KZX55130.1 hypothetical protein A3709_09075 [Halioglobus sp. HI00S01]